MPPVVKHADSSTIPADLTFFIENFVRNCYAHLSVLAARLDLMNKIFLVFVILCIHSQTRATVDCVTRV